MSALLLCALAAQDPVTIPRKDRSAYERAVTICREAEGCLEADPRRAIDLCTQALELVERNKLRHVERRLLLPESDGGGSIEYRFFPFQFRGRARMAVGQLEAAAEDFQKSSDAGCPASGELLKRARAEIESRKRKDPRAVWQGHIEARRFRTARGFAAKELPSAVSETDELCRRWVLSALEDFASGPSLAALGSIDFEKRFRVPDEAELVGTHPELPWARAQRDLLVRLRKKEDVDSAILRQVLEARGLAPAAANRFFRVSADLAHEILEARLRGMLERASKAPLAERRSLRAAAQMIAARWGEVCDPAFREHHPVLKNPLLATLAASFPADPEELDAVSVEGCFSAESPEAYLASTAETLRRLRKTPNLSRESEARALTMLVAAVAIREFLAGASEEVVARSLAPEGADLRRLGGPDEETRWGPRVARVFAALRRNP